jgi:hypothetical protein
LAWLGSTRNIGGCVCALVGLGLGAGGVVRAPWWLAAVAALYAAGALAVPRTTDRARQPTGSDADVWTAPPTAHDRTAPAEADTDTDTDDGPSRHTAGGHSEGARTGDQCSERARGREVGADRDTSSAFPGAPSRELGPPAEDPPGGWAVGSRPARSRGADHLDHPDRAEAEGDPPDAASHGGHPRQRETRPEHAAARDAVARPDGPDRMGGPDGPDRTAGPDDRARLDVDGLRRAAQAHRRTLVGRAPTDVVRAADRLTSGLDDLFDRTDLPPRGSAEAVFVERLVRRIVTDHLPTALAAYLDVPRTHAGIHRLPDGRTPHEVLLDQLAQLELAIREVSEAGGQGDTARLIARDRFLTAYFAPADPTPDRLRRRA